MGSRFLTKVQAAQVLGCSLSTICRKIQRGELRPVRQGKYVGVWEEDVVDLRNSQLKKDGERTLPFAINRQTLHRLDTEVRVLRRELDQVLRILNVRRETLNVSDLEMTALYTTAQQYAVEGWPPQIEETWANYFLRIQIENFRQIERLTKDGHPWRPFMKLISTMALRPYNTELAIQLLAGRDHIQQMATVWLEIKNISPRQFDKILRHETTPSKRLLKRLQKNQAKL